MEYKEFMKMVKGAIKAQNQIPEKGFTYIKKKNGEEWLFNKSLCNTLQPKELAVFILGLAKACDIIYSVGPPFMHPIVSSEEEKGESKNYKMLSCYHIDATRLTDLSVFDENIESLNPNLIQVRDICYSYDKDTFEILECTALTEIHTTNLKFEIVQAIEYLKWINSYNKKFGKVYNNLNSDTPMGHFKSDDLVNRFSELCNDHLQNVHLATSKALDYAEHLIETNKGFGTKDMQQAYEDLNNLIKNSKEKNKEDGFSKQHFWRKRGGESKEESGESGKSRESGSDSFKERMRKKFRGE